MPIAVPDPQLRVLLVGDDTDALELARSTPGVEVVAAAVTREQLDALVRRQTERELEVRQAQKLDAVGRLASGLAHELNTPLQFCGDNAVFLADAVKALTALVDIYRDTLAAAAPPPEMTARVKEAEAQADLDFLREQVPQAVDDLEQGLRRVATTVKALRSFSSVDQPGLAYVDLNAALRDMLIVAEHELRESAVLDLDLRPLPHVLCRPGDLNQVFLALVTNATQAMADVRKAVGSMGRLRIASRHEGEHVVVEISDTGTGIRDDIREHVFEPFFTTRGVGKGAGLGLALARGIVVHGHGGTVTFDTTVGKGTTFKVVLPVRPPASVAASVPAVLDEVA